MSIVRVVIVNDASEARGGATGLALLQARLLADRGIETIFFGADRQPNDALAVLGVRMVNAGSDPLMKAPVHRAAVRGLYNGQVRAALEGLIAEVDSPDTIYHVHSWSKTLTPSVFGALSRVASRTFLHAHDFFFVCPNGGFMDYQAMQPCARVPLSLDCLSTQCDKRNRAQKMWRVARQVILSRMLPTDAPWAGIVMIHPAMSSFLRMRYPEELLLAVRNPAVGFTATRVEAERNRDFLFIGRVEAEKGVEELIAAATIAGVPLRVIGDGPLREPLAARYPDVRFTGWLDRDAIAEEVRTARALVMPSRYPEPFGLVAAEASLSGLPVILSKSALLAREMEEKGLGFACDTRDPVAFAAALTHVATLPAWILAAMSALGASGEAGLSKSPDDWIDALLALYRQASRQLPAIG